MPALPAAARQAAAEQAAARLRAAVCGSRVVRTASPSDGTPQVARATQGLRDQLAAADARLADARRELAAAQERLRGHLEAAEERERQVWAGAGEGAFGEGMPPAGCEKAWGARPCGPARPA
jgi:hypothetical protein